jgi:hypothetical protein
MATELSRGASAWRFEHSTQAVRAAVAAALLGLAALVADRYARPVGLFSTGVLSAAGPCDNRSVGAIPIDDLGAGSYMGQTGGLYPGGSNIIPSAHEALGIAIAATLQPRDASGNPDPVNGRIVLISVGVSNTRNKFAGETSGNEGTGIVTYTNAFKPRADVDPEQSSKVILVNGAQGGEPVDTWNSETSAT